jgi:hypothetical protein
MSLRYYILKDGKIVPATVLEWAEWFGTAERIVRLETIAQNKISTIFLGLDHHFGEGGPPVLWETMTFGAKLDQEQRRCAGGVEQAEAMHEEMVEKVCKAYGIPYDPNRERIIDEGVFERLWERTERRLKEGLKKMRDSMEES